MIQARTGSVEHGHEFEELSSRTLDAAIDVHRQLGPGFLEWIYENAMKVTLRKRGIPSEFQREDFIFLTRKRSACIGSI